ncbi:MAG: NAD-dependent epimerase/dehydratase family protein [Acidobacteriota bacterium]
MAVDLDLTKYAGRRVLVTGGLGFIGSNLARQLVDLGARVLLVDSMIPDYGGNFFNIAGIEDRVKVNICDMRDHNGMRHLVRKQDFIFNLAGQVSHIDSMQDPETDLDINCKSQLSLLETLRCDNPGAKVVYASTRQIYGKPRYLPVDENHPLVPIDVNGINKISGEMYHLLYHQIYGIRTVSLRLTNTYGPRQLVKHNRQGFVGWFIRLAVEGKEIMIFGDGLQRRDFNYVDDAVDALLRAGLSESAEGQAINLGSTPPYTLLEFTRMLIECAGRGSYRLAPFPSLHKVIDIGDYFAAYDRAAALLGWSPGTPLPVGLAKTVEYYRRHLPEYI